MIHKVALAFDVGIKGWGFCDLDRQEEGNGLASEREGEGGRKGAKREREMRIVSARIGLAGLGWGHFSKISVS